MVRNYIIIIIIWWARYLHLSQIGVTLDVDQVKLKYL